MPCIKCSDGKWKYGEDGKCQYDTLEKCKEVEAAIHAAESEKDKEEDIINELKEFMVSIGYKNN